MRIVFLLDLVLLSRAVFHIAEGYLWLLFVLRCVFLAVSSFVGLCPQTMWCVFYIVEGYPLIRWTLKKKPFSVNLIVTVARFVDFKFRPTLGHALVSGQLTCSLELQFY